MTKWRVWNKHPNSITHAEKFRDDMITIKAGEYVLMDYEDAVQFKGQWTPMRKNAQGADDPAGFKVIFIEPHSEESPVGEAKGSSEFICNRDGRKFYSQKELDEHIKANYSEEIFKDAGLDEQILKNKKGKSA